MKKILASLALAFGFLALPAASPLDAQGKTPPEFDAVKWYNTPPLALAQLQGKAVLVEVFRTW